MTQLSPDFIQENKNHVYSIQKTGGPYSKKDRFVRRQEVYRLHFEMSYTAVKIAELMKINRNTINSDIKYWYSKLATEWQSFDIEAWTLKQLNRLESQRSRLREELEKQKDLKSRLFVEKLILEIDAGICKIMINTAKASDDAYEMALSHVNKWMEQNQIEQRFVGRWSLEKLTTKQYDKIKKIMKV